MFGYGPTVLVNTSHVFLYNTIASGHETSLREPSFCRLCTDTGVVAWVFVDRMVTGLLSCQMVVIMFPTCRVIALPYFFKPFFPMEIVSSEKGDGWSTVHRFRLSADQQKD